MTSGYEYIPEREQYIDEDDRRMQRRGMERAATLRNAKRGAARLAGAFMVIGVKCQAEVREARLLLDIAARNAKRDADRLCGALMAIGVRFNHAGEYDAEAGRADDRC